ncbi:metal-dependent transcriptional regulator [Natrarchaeobius sp. A-rgal3]|uniref:metal-dependent transcriptional regulator n=1 Tax=Natrarchaeobius versutus TaxID=1679078 RepID=UPI00350FB6E4
MTGAPQYLLVVYAAHRNGLDVVPPGHVADALGTAPSTTTEAFQRLADRGLVEYEPYDGVVLTADGHETAEELFEAYLTLSRFFRDVLEIDDHDREAMIMAGAVGRQVVDRLATTVLTEDVSPDCVDPASALPLVDEP